MSILVDNFASNSATTWSLMFKWGEGHDKAFEAVKECLLRLHVVALFDPKLSTRIDTDGSKLNGLGYSLHSRHLSETESRYALIEFEAFSVAWGVKTFHYFLAGLPTFLVRNYHRTLIPILNNYALNEIDNPRFQRLVKKLGPYQYMAEHISGVNNAVADAL